MAFSPVKFLFMFLLLSVIGWIIFIFTSRLLAWFLSRVMGASVGFRVAGWNCLRDVVVKFKKGAVESVSVGEIKLSLRQSLVKLGVGFISRDPKLQLLICDLEIVIRPSTKSVKKATSGKKSGRPRYSGRGKWMVVANMARFLSVSVTELVVKVPKATTEVKDLRVDIFKDGSEPTLSVKVHLQPILVHMGESRLSFDHSCCYNSGESISDSQTSLGMMERGSSTLLCEEFSFSCEFGHDREVGVIIRNIDVTSGQVSLNLNEELFLKSKSPVQTLVKEDIAEGATSDILAAKTSEKKQSAVLSLKKYTSLFPEKVSFNLPKLDVRFVHRAQNLVIDSNVTGIQLRSSKSLFNEDVGESTRFDAQLDFSEIHLLREGGTSIFEILKLAVVSSLYIPTLPAASLRAEVDVKLGGTQCNIIMSRIKPWMSLQMSKKKKTVLREESSRIQKSQTTDKLNAIMWTCTVSAPEMTIVLYSLSGSPLYHGCSQSSHVFANNIAATGTAVHMELGELHLHMADEYQECLKESLFGVETNTGSLMHIAKVSLDWGKKEAESHEEHISGRSKLVLSVDVTSMGIYLSYQRVESLISTAMSFQSLLKSLSSGKRKTPNRGVPTNKQSGKGVQLLKLNLEKCSVKFCGDVGVEDAVVADPKRVNYGSQGGKVTINVCADGAPRQANIISLMPEGCKHQKYSVSLDIFHLSVCVDKEKSSIQTDLERAKSIYLEFSDEQRPDKEVTLFDMKNAKFVRRSGGAHNSGIALCSLFSATDISLRWEPDAHISLFELVLRLRLMVHHQKLHNQVKEENGKNLVESNKKDNNAEPLQQLDKHHKKQESILAIDVEMLNIDAEVGDGVDVKVQVQSIFSENARIGVLLEGLMLSFNDTRVFKSSRMQISRIPKSSLSDAKVQTRTWDWVIQGLDVHICMPYRLQLRAIEDAVEDMLRGLKLITTAKANLIFPNKESLKLNKPSSSSPSKFGRVKFCIRKLTADIEEEPMQGWLDQHYHLMKNEACELAIRLKFLDNLVSEGTSQCTCKNVDQPEGSSCSAERKVINYNGVDIDLHDTSAVQRLREDLHKQSFQSYYQACKNLVFTEGSGAYKEGFQAGFKLTASRASLLSICSTDLDVTLTKIEGGDAGMVDTIKEIDPVALDNKIPFSRMYGSNILLSTASLVVQIRDYTPMFSGSVGKCEGRLVLAQQATCFQPQMQQDVFIGRWWKVRMLRSMSGTTPPMKTYTDLPLHFQKGYIGYGVGFEPAFTDISYAFTVALRRANLSVRNSGPLVQLPKKEKSLPWWDEVRNYIHGKVSLHFKETKWDILGSTDPYEKLDKLHVVSGYLVIEHSDGLVCLSSEDFKFFLSSLASLVNNCSLKLLDGVPPGAPFLEVPALSINVTMDWECDSGDPLNHYLWALPVEGKTRSIVYDPFRSTSLSLRWNISFRPPVPVSPSSAAEANKLLKNILVDTPTLNVGAHDLAWVIKFWYLNYLPPNKLRSFSRWPRFGVPRIPRSGNLSLDKVMTEFMLRIDSMPTCIKYMPLDEDDPARGLTFRMTRLKVELCYGRGRQNFTFDSKRDPLDIVYMGIDLHMLKAYLNKEDSPASKEVQVVKSKDSVSTSTDRVSNDKCSYMSGCTEKQKDDGFLLSSDYFTIRRHSPKADPVKLLAWQETGKQNFETTYVRSEFENGSESEEHTRSDPSDDDGFNVVIADNCQRVFVYGLKLLWTIENRDAVWSFVGGLSKAFQPPKPSPSRQYTQRKLLEKNKVPNESEKPQEDASKLSPSTVQDSTHESPHVDSSGSNSSPSHSAKIESSASGSGAKNNNMDDSGEEGTRHFMVNVIQPQFNLHSEEANGRFLLAAASGRVLARSFHSVIHVGYEMIEQALGTTENVRTQESQPELTWNRGELSVMLEHVQAHVAPTDVDPGAGLQWLPKILRSSPKVKRTGALLERVFMPCIMYFRYTRHKGGTADLKVKPLKELTFNSPNITATMTSRQFQVMLDVLSNLLFARLPKPRKSSISTLVENDEDVEEEADEVVPDGVEEVELARIRLEKAEQERKLLLDDIRKLSSSTNTISGESCPSPEKIDTLWMITCGRSILAHGLKKELVNTQNSRKKASAALRGALQNAAQLRLTEKEKNKSPSYAMRISLKINKVVWGMLADGKSFAEAEINNMVYDFDRDYKDVGIAQFTTKSIVVRNCLPNSKSNTLLAAWNPPPDWGKNVMLRVDAKQGAPNDGTSTLELFQVEIYPLKIHLTETMYRMMWAYLFPEEEQDSLRRQEVWKVSTTAGSKRVKKGGSVHEGSTSISHSSDLLSRSSAPVIASSSQSSSHGDTSQASKLRNGKAPTELRRTSSFDRSWEENVVESVANELVLQVNSPRSGPLCSTTENLDESSRYKSKDNKSVKPGRPSHEEKKVGKSSDEKRPRKMMEFHNIKISQVELLVTYEGSRFAVTELRLLMDSFHRVDFTGTWRRLFSRVKKHIIWGVLKSVTGMQGKKFKDKAHSHRDPSITGIPDTDLHFSDSDGEKPGKQDLPVAFLKRPNDGAGDGFVTSIRGLFNSQRRKAKAFVLRTMRGDGENDYQGDYSESDTEFSPFARQLTITKAKRLLRRHTKKFRRGQKGGTSQQRDSLPSTPREEHSPIESGDESSGSSPYEDFHDSPRPSI